MRRLFSAAVVAASAALVLSGCTNLLAGTSGLHLR